MICLETTLTKNRKFGLPFALSSSTAATPQLAPAVQATYTGPERDPYSDVERTLGPARPIYLDYICIFKSRARS
ncbi:Uncharacterized protein HZ326_20399 [Fusarium oxysporum f. sp. albedinis]|nr:Uncharacterized protein HZ326_20399 [Fusarium oxysporum f. sp. albedinis]